MSVRIHGQKPSLLTHVQTFRRIYTSQTPTRYLTILQGRRVCSTNSWDQINQAYRMHVMTSTRQRPHQPDCSSGCHVTFLCPPGGDYERDLSHGGYANYTQRDKWPSDRRDPLHPYEGLAMQSDNPPRGDFVSSPRPPGPSCFPHVTSLHAWVKGRFYHHTYIHPISHSSYMTVEAILGVSACAYRGYCVSESGGETQLPVKLPVFDVRSIESYDRI